MGAKIALIFGAACCANWDFLQPLRQKNPLVICADGGTLCAAQAGFVPALYVGDSDSGGMPPAGCEQILLPAEKDVTDLQAACEVAIARGATELVLTGCTGGRQDHHLANLQLLARLSEQNIEASILDSCNSISVMRPGTLQLRPSTYRYFSLVAITRRLTGLTITGAKYPLEQATVSRGDSLTVSNEITAPAATITLTQGEAWLIRSDPQ